MSATRRRDPARQRRWALLAALAAVLLGVAVAACGGNGDGRGQVYEIVVPLGTQERLNRGETVSVMPSLLEFRVGDTLRIRNEDVVTQAVGPYEVRPGEQFELRYGSPGHYEGMCSLSEDEVYEIVITE